MKVYTELNTLPNLEGVVLTIGMFDGIHLGHRFLLDRLLEAQKHKGACTTMVITFRNHPFEVLRKEAIQYLAPENYKLEVFQQMGIEHVVFLEFTEAFAQIERHEFLEYLCERLSLLHVVVGEGFRFGRGNCGDTEYLHRESRYQGFSLELIPAITFEGEEVSSRRIRKAIQEGELEQGAQMLGREYFIEETCIRGKQQGQTIQFPTINMKSTRMVNPLSGVYRSFVEIAGQRHRSMTFVNAEVASIESHVFDFDHQVYEQQARVVFAERVRGVLEFRSIEDLRQRLMEDKAIILKLHKEQGERDDQKGRKRRTNHKVPQASPRHRLA